MCYKCQGSWQSSPCHFHISQDSIITVKGGMVVGNWALLVYLGMLTLGALLRPPCCQRTSDRARPPAARMHSASASAGQPGSPSAALSSHSLG